MILKNKFLSLSFCIYSELPKNLSIQSLRENEYNYPILELLFRHLKFTFLYIYDSAIFDGSHSSKGD